MNSTCSSRDTSRSLSFGDPAVACANDTRIATKQWPIRSQKTTGTPQS